MLTWCEIIPGDTIIPSSVKHMSLLTSELLSSTLCRTTDTFVKTSVGLLIQ